jgi:endo-beta-N-acetylglucosaminidase D
LLNIDFVSCIYLPAFLSSSSYLAQYDSCRYDAVTTEGWLEWQNSLTPLNLPFFDATGSVL